MKAHCDDENVLFHDNINILAVRLCSKHKKKCSLEKLSKGQFVLFLKIACESAIL